VKKDEGQVDTRWGKKVRWHKLWSIGSRIIQRGFGCGGSEKEDGQVPETNLRVIHVMGGRVWVAMPDWVTGVFGKIFV